MANSAQASAQDLAVASSVQGRWRQMRRLPDSDAVAPQLGSIELVRAGASFPAGDAAPAPRLVTAGWACRRIGLPDGRRQILDFVLPGDVLICSDRPLDQIQADAITLVRLADLRDDSVAQALVYIAAEQEARLLNQIMRLGRHTAYERTIHLMLDFFRRLSLVGLTEGDAFTVPLTQSILAEALGLSIVHVNRTLQQLRRERLITFQRGTLTMLQPQSLQANPLFQAFQARVP